MNPNAVNLYLFGGSLGYAIGHDFGCAIGVAVVSGILFVISWFN